MPLDVLIVDDMEINLSLVRRLVEQMDDCSATCFSLPEAALAACVQRVPDLVIVDYLMPEVNGVTFIQRFRALPGRESIPVLMVTASEERSVRIEALEAGANDFLSKPLDRTEFFARTRNMLALRHSQRKLENRADWLAEEVKRATEDLLLRDRETIACMSSIAEYRDPETGFHTRRMAHYSRLIAEQLRFPAAQQQLLFDAAPMHDVGKVGISDHILLKPGRLDPQEFEIMKTHSEIGHRVLSKGSSSLMKMAAEIALSHHEKFDGSGYPRGLVGEHIPLTGRIVAVADVFDALTSARPYKPAWEMDRACQLLREGSGKHFDPACVNAFFARLDEALAIRHQLTDADPLELPHVARPVTLVP